MKKILSAVLSVLLFLTIFPTSVNAEERTLSEQEQLIEDACAIFPEYAKTIRDISRSSSTSPRTNDARKVVISETRDISENRSINFTQFSDGLVTLSEATITFRAAITSSSEQQVSTGTRGTANFKVTCPGVSSGVFYLNNFTYTLVNSGYDRINSRGSYTHTNCSVNFYVNEYISQEYSSAGGSNGTSDAEAVYYITFDADFTLGARFTVGVGDDTLKYSVA